MKKKLPLVVYFSFLINYLELVYKALVLNNVFSINSLTIILFSISFIMINTILCSLFSEKVNRGISIILSLFLTFIFVSQYVYYLFYDSIFSVYSVKEGTEQVFGEFFNAIVKMVSDNVLSIILLLMPFILFLIFGKKIFSFNKGKKSLVIESISLVVFIIVSLITVMFNDNGMYSLKNVYTKTHAPMITINKVGLLSMECLDLERYLFGFEEKLYNVKSSEVKPSESNKGDDIEEVKYNVLDIDFDKLISEEKDDMVKSMHEYFESVLPTKQNEYTGIFKGKNLIYITAEGFDKIAVNKELTPTLYKLVNNGFVFENYYQPLFAVSTSDGEYMV